MSEQQPLVGVVMGSDSDWPVMADAVSALEEPERIEPEVAAEGLKVLKAVAGIEGFKYELQNYDFGGDRYLRTGEGPLWWSAEEAVDVLRFALAVYASSDAGGVGVDPRTL